MNGFISTGSYFVITSSKIIRGFQIQNPRRGPYANEHSTYIQVNADGNDTWYTLGRGDNIAWTGTPENNTIRLRSNFNGAGFESSLALDDDNFSGSEV